jgi:deoxyribodipyrimidine photo-lyase
MASTPLTLVWFRQDLRLADNPALAAAAENGSSVLPVFIWSPEEDASLAPGAASRWWLHQSLAALDTSLRERGSKLTIRCGAARQELMRLVAESGAATIFWNRRYDPGAIEPDRGLKTEFRERGLVVTSFPGNLLFEPWTIRNATDEPYRVFTAFWKACLRADAPPTPLEAPGRLTRPSAWPESVALTDLALEPKIDWARGMRDVWKPGEQGALERMRPFLDGAIGAYALDRDRPDHPGTSRLSPHLHFGEISPRQVWHAAHGSETAPFLRQIIWREFAHHILYHFPQTLQQPLRPEFARFPWKMNKRTLQAWTRGNTGYPLVDAGMRELWQTGWMHNRVRMVTASFLVKHLLIPWQEGAAWFLDTLVDADLANNTFGWQWVAGCGADAAPYFRIFNPVIQSEKFDPNGDYVRRWIPELDRLESEWIHQPCKAPTAALARAGVELGTTYPHPIVEHEAARARALAALRTMTRSG